MATTTRQGVAQATIARVSKLLARDVATTGAGDTYEYDIGMTGENQGGQTVFMVVLADNTQPVTISVYELVDEDGAEVEIVPPTVIPIGSGATYALRDVMFGNIIRLKTLHVGAPGAFTVEMTAK